MMPSSKLSKEALVAIAVLSGLGMFAGSYVLAEGGFAHTPMRTHDTVYVTGPQAYFVAAFFFAFSCIGMLALLRAVQATTRCYVLSWLLYLTATCVLVAVLRL